MLNEDKKKELLHSLQPLFRRLGHRMISAAYSTKKDLFTAKCRHCHWEVKVMGAVIFSNGQILAIKQEGLLGRVSQDRFDTNICAKISAML